MTEARQDRWRAAGAREDGRSAMARASDARPPKFYDPARAHQEPPAVIAARERHWALNAEIERLAVLAAERSGADCVGPGAGWDPPDGDELAELAAARDRYQAAMAAVPGPEPGPPPAPPPVTAARRCGRCGYLTTAAGHRVMCDE